MISTLEMFHIGIGPSSSHTLAPMKAGKLFIDGLKREGTLEAITHIRVDLYGSLSLTGKGHQTDQAIILGLSGEEPETIAIESIPAFMQKLHTTQMLPLAQQHTIHFSPDLDMVFNQSRLPLHENGMTIKAFAEDRLLMEETYYSVGGGVVVTEENFGKPQPQHHTFPYAFSSGQDILDFCQRTALSVSALVLKNELSLRSQEEITGYCRKIWTTMQQCMQRGIHTEGLLPGPLRVPRRAPNLNRLLVSRHKTTNDPFSVMDWVNMWALAVSEENAAGGRVVTAPTNGACGIIPAVMAYYDKFIHPITDEHLQRFFFASGAIGLLYRMNASISGAEVGCQGEVGVACSMAAAGLAELLGASPVRVCMAAEIGMEHNLGLTCDPVGGQVQIPCIERNAINAIKAINAARMAMERASSSAVSLDKVIEAMFLTGKDMSEKYRETALGGLAHVGIVGCS